MPYITSSRRRQVEPTFLDEFPTNAGELNYVLSSILFNYLEDNGGRYQQINDVLGALEGAKLEFYRRLAAPYEDTKIKEHGDVYI